MKGRRFLGAACCLAVVGLLVAGCAVAAPSQLTPTPTVDVAALAAKAVAAYTKRDWPRAAALLRQLTTLRPQDADAGARYGQALYALKRYPEAVKAFRQAEALAPDNFVPIFGQAQAYAAMGRTREALNALERAIAVAPHVAKLHRWRVRLYLQAEDWDRALVAVLIGLHHVPDDPELKRQLQEILGRLTP